MHELTDSGILVRFAVQALTNAGLDAAAILQKSGASMLLLDDPHLRTPSSAQDVFWQAAEEVSGDPHIGLRLARHLPRFRGQVLEYLFSSSPTFGEGLRRALQYQRLLSDAILGRFGHEGDLCYLATGMANNTSRHMAECMMAGILQFFSQLTDECFVPVRVCFHHTCQAPVHEYEQLYGCPVLFEQPDIRIYFDPAILDRAFWHAEPELLRLHEQVANEKLAELQRLDLVAQIRKVIAQRLETGEISLEEVAAELGIRPRSLRSQLADIGTSFNHVLNDYRSRLARRLLAKTNESIEQIVYLTGFSEPSTFYRAFRRWTQETPIEYRRRKQQAQI